jgi:hypothetical protein
VRMCQLRVSSSRFGFLTCQRESPERAGDHLTSTSSQKPIQGSTGFIASRGAS